MNRYPLWKYLIIIAALVLGAVYTVPNFFGESPAVQIASIKATVHADTTLMTRVEQILHDAGVEQQGLTLDTIGLNPTVRVRFKDTDTQNRARELLDKELNTGAANDPTYIVAPNLVSRTPGWLQQLHALPMYLGLDLRGGVHFLMQVDLEEAVHKRLQGFEGDLRSLLRDKDIRYGGITLAGEQLEVRFRDAETRTQAESAIADGLRDLAVREDNTGGEPLLVATMTPAALKAVQDNALKQNITTLHNRINELGVAEPVIQQQGTDRVVVELPGVQDTARAKDIIGRTATLESRLVDTSPEALAAVRGGPVPFGSELFTVGRGAPVVLKKEVIFSGQQLQGAQATFDERQLPAVAIELNESAGRIMRQVTRANLKKPMAVVLFEKGRGEVLTVATIQSEFGSRFQITGLGTTQIANDLALLLRAGALAAPMQIIEERLIGPSLGAENIAAGFKSTVYGFCAISAFMAVYYVVFGIVSVLSLAINLMLLVALLSMLQATLTLPGIAAIAFTLGMAIDANVLINERIREELRKGAQPQQAIAHGYERAFATILDSNVTTLIAGIFLFMLGSGPVRGFAVVHCLGIMTSIFSAVFISRGVVNLLYGSRRRLQSIAIGQIWRPAGAGG
jgi:preprotein translocase subunit SecD